MSQLLDSYHHQFLLSQCRLVMPEWEGGTASPQITETLISEHPSKLAPGFQPHHSLTLAAQLLCAYPPLLQLFQTSIEVGGESDFIANVAMANSNTLPIVWAGIMLFNRIDSCVKDGQGVSLSKMDDMVLHIVSILWIPCSFYCDISGHSETVVNFLLFVTSSSPRQPHRNLNTRFGSNTNLSFLLLFVQKQKAVLLASFLLHDAQELMEKK